MDKTKLVLGLLGVIIVFSVIYFVFLQDPKEIPLRQDEVFLKIKQVLENNDYSFKSLHELEITGTNLNSEKLKLANTKQELEALSFNGINKEENTLIRDYFVELTEVNLSQAELITKIKDNAISDDLLELSDKIEELISIEVLFDYYGEKTTALNEKAIQLNENPKISETNSIQETDTSIIAENYLIFKEFNEEVLSVCSAMVFSVMETEGA